MKKTLVLACALALIAAAAFAQAPAQHRVTLADIMAPAESPAPAATAPAPANPSQPLFLSSRHHGILHEKATCTANCASGTVTCTASSQGACFAQNVNCPTTQGYVTCDGATTYCPTSCGGGAGCTPGAIRTTWDGFSCCDQGGKDKIQEQCSSDGTTWNYIGDVCMGPCGPRVP
jgi:hypothetical protein